MKKHNYKSDIEQRIERLQAKQKIEFQIVKLQLESSFESLKPINLVKDTFNQVQESPKIKQNIIKTTVGILGGYLSKQLLIGKSNNPLTKISGAVIQYLVTNFITNKVDQSQAS